jgi:hypothetical protein
LCSILFRNVNLPYIVTHVPTFHERLPIKGKEMEHPSLAINLLYNLFIITAIFVSLFTELISKMT